MGDLQDQLDTWLENHVSAMNLYVRQLTNVTEMNDQPDGSPGGHSPGVVLHCGIRDDFWSRATVICLSSPPLASLVHLQLVVHPAVGS